MKVSDIKDIAMLGAIGFGVYLIYKFANEIPSADDVARAAKGAVNLLTQPRAQALGQIRLPSGQVIAVNDVVKAGGMVDSSGAFTWQGTRYVILSLGPDGVYEVM